MSEFLHNRSDVNQLRAIVVEECGINPVLVEKDCVVPPLLNINNISTNVVFRDFIRDNVFYHE